MGDDDFPETLCRLCGALMEWADCDACGGEGEYDAYEEDPLWFSPGDTEPCPLCSGDGGWWYCPDAGRPGHGD